MLSADLPTAAAVARRILDAYGNPDGYDIIDYAQAYGAMREALRIMAEAAEAGDVLPCK